MRANRDATIYLAIAGHASADAGSADFSMRATPMLGRPGWEEVVDDEYGQWTLWHEPTDEIGLDITHLKLDDSLAWWAMLWLIGGTFPLGAVVTLAGAAQFVLNMVHLIMGGYKSRSSTKDKSPSSLLVSSRTAAAAALSSPLT